MTKKNVVWWPAVKNVDHNDKFGNFEYFQYSRNTCGNELPEIKPMLRQTSSQQYRSFDSYSDSGDDTINERSRKPLTRFNTAY